ncbi:MAG: cytochrome c oxidase accessory protein CcoG, partial [Bdellovibrionales bacterium]|nr:cytochrome c oxidase accessory protein CcoG [Bdellovibrionales bacterium]
EDRLASLTSDGRRSYIYPAEVRGFFQRYRQIVQALLMVIFLVLPWISINGQQALLFNIPQRHFSIFGLTFMAHDTPLFFFVLALLTLGLAFVTSLWGRVWCGWTCPQTVFIESIFRRIERWIEGQHLAQRKLNEQPLNFTKLWKKSLKWFIFALASLVIAHSFLAYFVGTNELFHMVRQPPTENWTSFLIMSFISLLILFDFGWFREQFCIIACPYGRFQSVLMDQHTINICYDEKRGEPRKGLELGSNQSPGDCVNCYRCVQVCPTGVDIRRGVQLECIACTACIDACDEIMTKVKKPKGLIRYTSESALAGVPHKMFRFRNFVYLFLILIVASGLVFATARRNPIQITLLRAKDIPYRVVPLDSGIELSEGATGLVN